MHDGCMCDSALVQIVCQVCEFENSSGYCDYEEHMVCTRACVCACVYLRHTKILTLLAK